MSGRVVTLKTKPKSRARKGGSGGALSVLDIVQILRERIARQDVAPGAKLGEQELAAEFGVPRTRIREVLGVLDTKEVALETTTPSSPGVLRPVVGATSEAPSAHGRESYVHVVMPMFVQW